MTALPLNPELLDTFRSLSVKKRQGVLEIISPTREYELTFFEGKIIHADRLDRSFIDYLSEQVTSVSKLNSEELESVGRGEQITRLLQLTELDLSNLINLKKSYDKETLAQLALEQRYSFDFRTKIVRCPEGLSLELSPGHYILDLLEGMLAKQEALAQPKVEQEQPTTPIEPVEEIKASPAVFKPEAKVELPELNKVKSIKKRARRRKNRRPPKAGRFRTEEVVKKSNLISALKLTDEQAIMGVKLLLILLMMVFAPGFIASWGQVVFDFVL